MTMLSAPSGSGAPVKMRTASPGPTAPLKPCPAALMPMMRRASRACARHRRVAPRSRPWRRQGRAADRARAASVVGERRARPRRRARPSRPRQAARDAREHPARSASSTRDAGSWRLRSVPERPPLFLAQADALDAHAAVGGLHHVVDRSGRRRRRRSAPPSRRRSGPTPSPSAVTRTPGSASSRTQSTVTLESSSGWQSGISSWVRLAAMMPASRAVPSTSPFLASPGADQRQRLGLHHDGALGDRRCGASRPCRRRRPCWRRLWRRDASGALMRAFAEQKRAGRGGDVGLPHQALADEEGADADAPTAAATSAMGEDAALADDDAVGRDQRRELLADRKATPRRCAGCGC